jgi:CRP/FNR family transcriptional regulator
MLLLEEAQRKNPVLRDGVSFSMPLSHMQLASRLGSVREVVSRSLQKLVQKEVLAIRGHRIVILDLKTLCELTENHHQS